MRISKIPNDIDAKSILTKLGVDGGGINILASKMHNHIIYIHDLHVGGANILKQDALSIGADLAVPRGTVVAAVKSVDCILIATTKQLQTLSRKELAQPFGLKELALYLQEYLKIQQPKKAQVMGIINTNEDSFYEGSRFNSTNAYKRIIKMIEDGASIIDIGGVSSRPNAPVVTAKEELRRVEAIYEIVAKEELYKKVKFSCDSYEPIVIQRALESGFSIVNDITGLENDEVCKLCAEYNATAIIMHMQGSPQTMQNNPIYEDMLYDVYSFLEQRVQKAESFGVKDIILDVGIGFGKTLDDNLKLINYLDNFLLLGKSLLVGASRKSMIDTISPSSVQERLGGTIAIHLEAIRNGASIVRVHDVKEHSQAIKIHEALKHNTADHKE